MTTAGLEPPYRYSPIIDRDPLVWPGGARVAVYVGLNIEHFLPGRPSTSIWPGTADLTPDPLNHGWRDYGNRVGIWRTIGALDDNGFRASALVNSAVVQKYPQIVSAGISRDWVWLAHGETNSVLHTGLDVEEERRILGDIASTIADATGRSPRGWMGPGLTETHHTPELLAELGFDYLLDWTNDDQPYELEVPGLLSIPYSVELNDLLVFGKGHTGADFSRMIIDAYEQLSRDAADGSGRVLALALHPFVIGQPFRQRYLDESLRFLAAQPDAWITTSDEIADHFLARQTSARFPK